ncbi:MAG: hypothetical protein ABI823_04610 [Bryobacteraceae bacterium]
MTKITLLAIALSLPMISVGKTSSAKPGVTKESPIPDCFPCIGGGGLTSKSVVRESPIPDCYPCIGPGLTAKIVVRESPIPECLPCRP